MKYFVASLPPVEDILPVDLTIHIRRHNAVQYHVYVKHKKWSKPKSCIAEGKFGDFEELRSKLLSSIKTLIGENIDRNLYQVARYGYAILTKLFPDKELLKSVLDILNEEGSVKSVSFVADEFFMPWELLYTRYPTEKEVSVEDFLGSRHIISRIEKPVKKQSGPVRNGLLMAETIKFSNRPKLALLPNKELNGVSTIEIPFFNQMHDRKKIVLHKIRDLEEDKFDEGFRIFLDFIGKDYHVIHFACHTKYDGFDSFFNLYKNFNVTILDLDFEDFEIKSSSLIFFNTCESGILDAQSSFSLASKFQEYGAIGVIGTLSEIDDDLAADFSGQLYSKFLAGKTVGASILEVRKEFAKKGIMDTHLYALYGRAGISLKKINDN
ncbi:CHAT domain-containing protein [Dyadobacter diqingensis]|uniref:CHAT domain-containing protein n=1 Tax=Dyadobacter diqingensis TaxID=2938121 RepID=UPI0020C1B14B|nr:CHAT domain-containing protein [Dyadobacter diqingensis]